MIRLLLDERLPRLYEIELKKKVAGLDIRHVGGADAPPTGTPDPDILSWCEANQFLLVTNNRNTMPPHLSAHLAKGKHIPGILLLTKNAYF